MINQERAWSQSSCPGSWAWRRGTVTHHVFDLAVPVAEDDGVGGVAHRQHHCKGDAHGDWDQGVEWIDVQRFGLEVERMHRSISIDVRLAFPALSITDVLFTMARCWPTLAGHLVLGVEPLLSGHAVPAKPTVLIPLTPHGNVG